MKKKYVEITIPCEQDFKKGIKCFRNHEKRDSMYKIATYLIRQFWGKPVEIADALGVLLLTWNQAFYRYGSLNIDKLDKCVYSNLKKLNYFRGRKLNTTFLYDKEEVVKIFRRFYIALENDIIKFSDEYSQLGQYKKYSIRGLKKLLAGINIFCKKRKLKNIYNSIKDTKELYKVIEFIDKEKSDSKKNYIVLYVSKTRSKFKKRLDSLKLIRRSPVAVSKVLHLLAPNYFPLWDYRIANKYNCNYEINPEDQYYNFCIKIKNISNEVKDYKICKDSNKSVLKLIDEYNYAKFTKGWID